MKNKYKEAFELIKIAGSLAAETLDEITSYVKPGVSTNELDNICYEFIRDNGGYSAPLFYKGFPKSCCTSANHVVCHGIPTNKYLHEGDIITIDVIIIVIDNDIIITNINRICPIFVGDSCKII